MIHSQLRTFLGATALLLACCDEFENRSLELIVGSLDAIHNHNRGLTEQARRNGVSEIEMSRFARAINISALEGRVYLAQKSHDARDLTLSEKVLAAGDKDHWMCHGRNYGRRLRQRCMSVK